MTDEKKTRICRICLDDTKDLEPIFPIDEIDNPINNIARISDTILEISAIKFSKDDLLPNFVCGQCIKKLEEINEFIVLIKSSDKYLRSFLCKNLPLERADNNASIPNESTSDNPKPESICLLDKCEQIIKKSIKTENVRANEQSNATVSSQVLKIIIDSNIEENLPKKRRKNSGNQQTKKPKYQCYECGKLLSSHYSLKKHTRTHTGEKPYICAICKKSFSSAFNLKIHGRIHTGEKPLQCQFCTKKFAQPASLISHQRNHSGELPYKCHLCPRVFKSNSSLKYHIVTHTGEKKFFCSICKRGFITKGDVKNHEKTHSDERPFVCTICGLSLRRAYGLKRHMQGHRGIKNYECNICHVAFSQKYDLKRHIESHMKKIRKKDLKKLELERNVEEELNLLNEISLSN